MYSKLQKCQMSVVGSWFIVQNIINNKKTFNSIWETVERMRTNFKRTIAMPCVCEKQSSCLNLNWTVNFYGKIIFNCGNIFSNSALKNDIFHKCFEQRATLVSFWKIQSSLLWTRNFCHKIVGCWLNSQYFKQSAKRFAREKIRNEFN